VATTRFAIHNIAGRLSEVDARQRGGGLHGNMAGLPQYLVGLPQYLGLPRR